MLVSLENAKIIQSKIIEKGFTPYTEYIDHIFEIHDVEYIYTNEEIRNNHIKDMEQQGWTRIDSKVNECIYSNLYSTQDDSIYMPCAFFRRRVRNVLFE